MYPFAIFLEVQEVVFPQLPSSIGIIQFHGVQFHLCFLLLLVKLNVFKSPLEGPGEGSEGKSACYASLGA